MHKSDNFIMEFTFQFALKIIKYSELLASTRKFIMADQLYRCGTSIGSQVSEAQSPESNRDFIHKFKIADKEAEETLYRLRLCKHSKGYPDCDDLLNDIVIIKNVIGKIISSSKR
ncbi:MAG: four helix bundle protein [Bacteroidota bacterium]